MRFRKLHRRFGITAPRVVIRNHIPWGWIVACSLFWLFLSLSAYIYMRAEAYDMDSNELHQQILSLRNELSALSSSRNTASNLASMEKATQQQLSSRIQSLERENAALKEDIRLFERLVPPAGDEAQIHIDNAQVVREDNAYRYRIVLAYRPSKQIAIFRGKLQLALTIIVAGETKELLIPEQKEADAFQLEVKHFARREGRFQIPDGALLKTVEIRVLQGDTLRAKHTERL